MIAECVLLLCWVLFFFHTELRDWLGRNVSEMTFLCGVGRKTTTQSISLWGYADVAITCIQTS